MWGKINKKPKSSNANTTPARVCKGKLLHSKLECEAVWHWISHTDQLQLQWGAGARCFSLGVFKQQSLNGVSPVELNPLCPWGAVLACRTLMFCCFGIRYGDTKSSFKISWGCLVHANGALIGNGC